MNWRKQFIVAPGAKVDLSNILTDYTGAFDVTEKDAEKAKKQLKNNKKKLNELQTQLYGEHKRSVLLIMQAMDAAGKDGTISKVFGAMNPQGTHTVSFKKPTERELSHHFLWRVRQHEPSEGHVSIFNRSHYEDVLIVRVHDLVSEEKWRPHFDNIEDFWAARMQEIRDYEQSIARNGTQVLKFFLHVGKDEQLRRFWDRVAQPEKNWKISNMDYSERQYWEKYQAAYEAAISATSTEQAPWFIIPADHKWFSRLAVSEILIDHLESLGMKYPEPEMDADEIKKKYFGVNNPGDKPRFDLI